MTILYLAIDPGHEACGLARKYDDKEIRTTHCSLSDLSIYLEFLGGNKVIAVVERSTCTLPRFRAHRAAAKACEKAIKATWPRRNKIYTVDPRVWQAAMLKGCFGADTKEQSIYRARLDGYTGDNHNEADAFNLLTYLETTILGGERWKMRPKNTKELKRSMSTKQRFLKRKERNCF